MATRHSFQLVLVLILQLTTLVIAQSSCPTAESLSTAADGSTWYSCRGANDRSATSRTITRIASSAACRDICRSTNGCRRVVYDSLLRYCLLKGNSNPQYVSSSRYESIRFNAAAAPSKVAPPAAPASSAVQSSAQSRASLVTSQDGTCGGTAGFTCNGFSQGTCCSAYGWCGDSDVHCGADCQTAFGTCSGAKAVSSAVPSVVPKSQSTFTVQAKAVASAQPSGTTSKDGSCGKTTGFTCIGYVDGECCSSYGYCGQSDVHCGDGCQAGFGKCNQASAAASPTPSAAVDPPCACGYRTDESSVYTEAIVNDFVSKTTDLTALAADWLVQEYRSPITGNTPYNKQRSSKNTVFDATQGLQMFVRKPVGQDVGTSEMRTVRNDIKYGSFRANLKYTDVSGTCGAFFFYANDKAEIDVELLSKDPWYAQLVLHTNQNLPSSDVYDRRYLGFQTGAAFNDYRFDWKPDSIAYSFNGQASRVMTRGVPQIGGGIYFNHWSDGSGWTSGPPNRDVSMIIKNSRLYFNSSDPNVVNAANARCQAARSRGKGEVCDVRKT